MSKSATFRDGAGAFFHKDCLELSDLDSGLYTIVGTKDIPVDEQCAECGGPLDDLPAVDDEDAEDDDESDEPEDPEDDNEV